LHVSGLREHQAAAAALTDVTRRGARRVHTRAAREDDVLEHVCAHR